MYDTTRPSSEGLEVGKVDFPKTWTTKYIMKLANWLWKGANM